MAAQAEKSGDTAREGATGRGGRRRTAPQWTPPPSADREAHVHANAAPAALRGASLRDGIAGPSAFAQAELS